MSDRPEAKRGRFTPSPTSEGDFINYDSVLKVEQWAQSHSTLHPLCITCSSAVCRSCVQKLQDLGRNEDIAAQFKLNQHVDIELLQSIPKQKQRPRRKQFDSTASVPHFRLPLLSDTSECHPETTIHGDALSYLIDDDITATRSHMSVENILCKLRESLTPHTVLSRSECELRDITLEELNNLSKFRKLSIIGQLFQQATSTLSELIAKSQVESYNCPFSHSTDQLALYAQLNTVGSYGLMTLLNCCDNYTKYLFTPKLSRQVLSIVTSISQIVQVVPEARELIFLEETFDDANSPFSTDDSSLVSQTFPILVGIKCREKANFPTVPLYNKRDSSQEISALFQHCQLIDPNVYQGIAQSLINQVAIVLLHPQMNLEIVVACLNLFSNLNLHNPGKGPECLKNILRDDQLNVLFELALDSLDCNVLTALVRFYSSVPLTPYFVPLFQDNKLFGRCIRFIRESKKTDQVILDLKLKFLSFLTSRIHLHRLPLSKVHLVCISDITQSILSSFSFCDKYTTRNSSENLCLIIRFVYLFLYQQYPAEFHSKSKIQRNDSFQNIEDEVFAKSNATFELIQFDNILKHHGLLL